MHYKQKMLASVVMSALALGATPALAAAAEGGGLIPDRGADSFQAQGEVQAAIQRDLGLSPEQAKKQQALQAKAIELDEALQSSLGEAYAGSSYDAATGRLVVMVSDAKKADQAKASGAEVRQVKHSKTRLDAIKDELDVSAGKAKGSSAMGRQPHGPRQSGAAGMTSWYVDTARNVVAVTVQKGQAKAAARKLARFGDAVTIAESDLAPTPAAAYMDGGDMINGASCSAGFNVRNPSTGRGYLITAGHCVGAGSTLRGQGGFIFGPVLERFFPSYDDAIARNDSGGYFIQGPWVDTNPSNGGVITTRGYTDAPVGTTVCKSGVTTRWTCGWITAKNETVTMDGTNTVYGLTRHSACVEKGDSGGANVSWTGTYAAEGVSSGASLIWDGTRYRCLSAIGQTNVSWYFPIADSMAYYGPRYGVSMWP